MGEGVKQRGKWLTTIGRSEKTDKKEKERIGEKRQMRKEKIKEEETQVENYKKKTSKIEKIKMKKRLKKRSQYKKNIQRAGKIDAEQ